MRRPPLRRALQQAGVALVAVEEAKPQWRLHAHDAIEMVVVRRGRLRHEIAGHRFRSGPGCIDLVPPGQPHRYEPLTPDCRLANLICDPLHCPADELGGDLAQLARSVAGPQARRPCQIRMQDGRERESLLDGIAREQRGERPGWAPALRSWYRLLLLSLARGLAGGRVRWAGEAAAGIDDPRLRLLRMAVDDHPELAWDLGRMAAELGVGREQCCRRFRAAYGRGPMAYVAERRLHLVQDLLLRGRPIAAAARAAGFPSRQACTRAFTTRLGLSPRAWLKQVRL